LLIIDLKNMIMSNLQLHQTIDILPLHLQKEVADYVAFLCFKYGTTSKSATDTNAPTQRLPLKFGAGKGLVAYISDDFDAPLDHFKEYIP
jgi:Protein of unknown function (DUF2281)